MSHERFSSRVNGPTLRRVNEVRWLEEVTPRHLAGGGDPRHLTEYLLAAGWANHSVPGYPHVLLESPDQQLHLALEPTAPEERDPWWRVHPAEDRSWGASFGGHTPVEIIAGFTDALIRPNPPAPANLWDIAASHGWAPQLGGRDQAALSPDQTAVLARVQLDTTSDTPLWHWTSEVSLPLADGRRQWIWGAAIDGTAPAAALAGFIAALTDPAPLLRDEGQTPPRTFGFLRSVRSPVFPEQHRRRHLQRIEGARRAAPSAQSRAGRPAPPRPASRKKR